MSSSIADYSFSLKDKVAIVTGAAAGIGQSIVEAYIAKGARVVLFDISEKVHEIAESMGQENVFSVRLDVTKRDEINKAIELVIEKFGRIDILVNSAGIVSLESAEHYQEKEWDRTLDVNLKSVFMLCQAVGNVMLSQKYGRIINLASQAGVIALDKHLAYCVSKAGVISLTQVLALEWSQYGITVNAISPTVVLTELGKKAWEGEVGEIMKQKIPVRRFAVPEEIAASAVYLASDMAGMVTGANMIIDGGYTIQ
ncbi:D-threitol dehydrogenase [Zobellella endophytica]|uniref:D-threitol dehydrogenase n=1 Tax=Zobellella endophytica TaxID=2116700 RepID=A0A2P7R4S5_9GAMM|nr:D-threitol dehydrogenase [Zobellella endophytica]PSJ45205.1 D-threitol dehydrogenase [Zobellella endophytica]